MKRELKRYILVVLWALALALSVNVRADAMGEWRVALALLGDLRTPPSPSALAKGAAAIERARSIGGTTERECELIDAVAQFYGGGDERTHDMRLVHYERALSRAHRHLPDDPEIVSMHAHASQVALARARERAEAAYAKGQAAQQAQRMVERADKVID